MCLVIPLSRFTVSWYVEICCFIIAQLSTNFFFQILVFWPDVYTEAVECVGLFQWGEISNCYVFVVRNESQEGSINTLMETFGEA